MAIRVDLLRAQEIRLRCLESASKALMAGVSELRESDPSPLDLADAVLVIAQQYEGWVNEIQPQENVPTHPVQAVARGYRMGDG